MPTLKVRLEPLGVCGRDQILNRRGPKSQGAADTKGGSCSLYSHPQSHLSLFFFSRTEITGPETAEPWKNVSHFFLVFCEGFYRRCMDVT